ncbi:MAG: oxygen-independent coproporphyrinogen III oxidase [Rhizobiaceae bacterium]|jgi:oxygen-independent coproporphyrinogen-3 oxidase|nr:oxygen-independent coproporphyrinogen III oxidase [Rhizobiaceae bacterium]
MTADIQASDISTPARHADAALVERYAKPVPRYTSYPTAPHFNADVGPEKVAKWLATLDQTSTLSLYAHIPFCDTLCWFCGCHTRHTLQYKPIAAYLEVLKQEIAHVGDQVHSAARVMNLHFGGGSPTILSAADLKSVIACFRENFRFDAHAEVAFEIDPRDFTADKMDALAEAGMNRASIGVQDFDPDVQAAINRFQTVEETRAIVDGLRARGIRSLNIDALYGLPRQSLDRVLSSLGHVAEMRPDRIALFGYAHVPWMKKHMSMIKEADLPSPLERFEQAQAAAEFLVSHGYERIGFDHFALPGDSMAVAARAGRLKRNFQGYTDDPSTALIGFGASSISEFPQGYAQNAPATGDYMRRVRAGEISTVRGYKLLPDDRMRKAFIEQLLCQFRVDAFRFTEIFGDAARPLFGEAMLYAQGHTDGLCDWSDGVFSVTDAGRPFVRMIAAQFDAFLNAGAARHSIAV